MNLESRDEVSQKLANRLASIRTWLQRIQWREALILLALGFQLFYLGKSYLVPQFHAIRSVWGLSAIERSARLQLDDKSWSYIEFIREVVPEDPNVTVVLQYREKGGPFTFVSLMQYYFFPREVDNCSDPLEDCLGYVTGSTKYVLGGPPEEAEELTHHTYLPFDEKRGIYLPMPGGE